MWSNVSVFSVLQPFVIWVCTEEDVLYICPPRPLDKCHVCRVHGRHKSMYSF